MKRQILIFVPFLLLTCCEIQAQDSTSHIGNRYYKELTLTIGYNYNSRLQQKNEELTTKHFIELGLWKSHVFSGHHPVTATYYVANDFGVNENDFVIGPKIGGFVSIMVLGLGGEFCYYTNFDSDTFMFIPSFGLFTPYFKLTINPYVLLENEDSQNKNIGHFNLTIRVFKLKRTNS